MTCFALTRIITSKWLDVLQVVVGEDLVQRVLACVLALQDATELIVEDLLVVPLQLCLD